jgi:ferredoxin
MKVAVDPELCISCGLCVNTCPDVFEWGEDEKAKSAVDEVPEEHEEYAHEAVEGCPTSAISEE